MSLPGGSNLLLLTSAAGGGGGGYEISRSLRFNSSDSAYLSRVPSTAGNRKTWTWAGWVKRSALGSNQVLLCSVTANGQSTNFTLILGTGDKLAVEYGTNFWLQTTQVFRDASAWFHLQLTVDTTQATSSERMKLWVNGSQVTAFDINTPPAQNTDLAINRTELHTIGSLNTGLYFSGYLADIHFIDGQALDPSDFGEFDTNGVWQPKTYAGSYGTNGFHLPFSDNSTAAALGTDTSGNGNTWTANNITAASAGTVNYASPSNWTQTGTGLNTGSSYFNAWDGNTTGTATVFLTSPSPDNDVAYTVPGGGVAVSSYVRLWVGAHSASERQWRVNSESYQSNNTTGYLQYNFTGTLTSISGYNTWPGTNSMALYAVEVDGTVLVYIPGQNVDSLVDSPTNGSQVDTGAGGEVVGNYCTLNSLSSALTLVNGNLDFNKGSAADWKVAKSTFFVATGKWYWEVTVAAYSSGGQPIIFGIANDSSPLTGTDVDITAGLNGYFKDGQKRVNSTTSSYGASYTNGDVIGFAFDLDAGTLTAYKNGSSQGTLMSSITGSWTPAIGLYTGSTQLTSDSLSINFGQRPFAYTAPSGFKALCTTNLPEPTIADGSTAMDVALYTGNGSTQTISGLNFSPDLVWLKARSAATAHLLFDQIRGATYYLSSNATDAESNSPSTTLTAFTSDGFTLGSNSSANGSSVTLTAWTWDAGSSTVTNTQGSITSSVRASASSGFSVVSYTGTGSAATVGHGLGVAPGLIILKDRTSGAYNWQVYHSIFAGTSNSIVLNSTAAVDSGSGGVWNSTAPTSTVFSIGTSVGVNTNGNNYVAYCWAPVTGYSSMLSFVGNGSSDGPFCFTGFRPRWIILKNASVGAGWYMFDAVRNPYNLTTQIITANTSSAEYTDSDVQIDILSNGFKLRSAGGQCNGSSSVIVYAAFAESPLQYARAR